MGSYDTGECNIMPGRIGSYDTAETNPRSSRLSSTVRRPVSTQAPPDPRPYQETYDPSLKTVVSLGGGLTPDRIVQPVPEEVQGKSINEVVQYLMDPEIATRSEDVAIVEAIEDRMQKNDYRVIINDSHNFGNDRMADRLTPYLSIKEQQRDDGALMYNYCDIAIVSHEEGGTYSTLEKLL